MERLSDDNYQRLMGKYQAEQKDFKEQKAKLDSIREEVSDLRTDSEKFVALVEEYGNITELSPEVLNMLIDRIVVHTPVPVDGVMHQQIDVYYRYVGSIRIVGYGSTTYYKHGAVTENTKKRESAKMDKRIAVAKEEISADVPKTA